jgi:tetraacyldisaccharide 4'-kinase
VHLVERIWEGDAATDRLARAALFPFEVIYRGIVAARGELYDRSLARVQASSIPVVSIGNLTVGGTGKTPFASWIAGRLAAAGMMPAIVLRGYGGDEILVHRKLNPGMQVIADPSRSAGIAVAAENGANVAVLDDAFQHRRATRDVDIVLLSADSWTGKARLLPAGPWREPLSAIGRASLAVITRKAVTDDRVADLSRALRRAAPLVPQAAVDLSMTGMTQMTGTRESASLDVLKGKKVLAVSAIGNPVAFARQLHGYGAFVGAPRFADHHAFSRDDVAEIIRASVDWDMIVCTLKDAVKLVDHWPADGPPLWYVSQTVSVVSGAPEIDQILSEIRSTKSSQPT